MAGSLALCRLRLTASERRLRNQGSRRLQEWLHPGLGELAGSGTMRGAKDAAEPSETPRQATMRTRCEAEQSEV